MQTKLELGEKDIPKTYLNISYYLKKYLGRLPEPPLHPGTKKPLKAEDLYPISPQRTYSTGNEFGKRNKNSRRSEGGI